MGDIYVRREEDADQLSAEKFDRRMQRDAARQQKKPLNDATEDRAGARDADVDAVLRRLMRRRAICTRSCSTRTMRS